MTPLHRIVGRHFAYPALIAVAAALSSCGGSRAADPAGIVPTTVADSVTSSAGTAKGADAIPPGSAERPPDPGGDGGMADSADGNLDGGEAPGPEVTEGLTVADARVITKTNGSPAPAAIAPAAAGATARLRRLTEPGCCVQPFWSADSRRVQFIDRPASDAPAGIWSVGVDPADADLKRVADEVANYSADLAYRIDLGDDSTTITRRADGSAWTIPTGGRPLSISPGLTRVAWQVNPPPSTPEQQRTSRVWTANLDGSDAREVAVVPRGAFSGWLGEDRLLLRGRDRLQSDEDVLWVLDLAGGDRREIARSERLRGELVSPGGQWIAYYVAHNADTSTNGLWLVSASGGAPKRLDHALFGAYRWRNGSTLLIVPLAGGSGSQRLIEVDAATLAARELTGPRDSPFKIANGDWSVSPDGRRVAYVEAKDKAIWLMELP